MNGIFMAIATGFFWSVPSAAIVWLALRIARNTLNAATRYGVWWAALIVVAAIAEKSPGSSMNSLQGQVLLLERNWLAWKMRGLTWKQRSRL